MAIDGVLRTEEIEEEIRRASFFVADVVYEKDIHFRSIARTQPMALMTAQPVIHQSIADRELTLWAARKFVQEAGR